MGTSDAYSGGGGAAGEQLRHDLDDWLDSLPGPPGDGDGDDNPPAEGGDRPSLPPETLIGALGMFRPSGGGSSDGPGGGGGHGRGTGEGAGRTSGGAQRSVRASASTAGRAAAAAYALRTGDAAGLAEFGLDLAALRANPDPIDVARQIVNAACEGPLSDGTIEDEERRYVAADVAQWVLEENAGGAPPTPEEIVRKSIAVIICEAAQNETIEMIRRGERPPWASLEAERQLRDAADVLSRRVQIPPAGLSDAAFAAAIESGIESLRRIRGDAP